MITEEYDPKIGDLWEVASRSSARYKRVRIVGIKKERVGDVSGYAWNRISVYFYNVAKDRRKLENWGLEYFVQEFQRVKDAKNG